MATLFVCATPIGNLSDASPRLKETLAACPLVLCEDTRVTLKLFSAFGIPVPQLLSCHQFNEKRRAEPIIARMVEEGIDVALVTDAGTPCVSDPGYAVVEAAVAAGLPVRAVAGPSAVAAALSVAGFPIEGYAFLGFLPREGKERREALDKLRALTVPVVVVYESPFRVIELVEDLAAALPGGRGCLCCDLTKLHELSLYGSLEEILAALKANPKAEKGEYALVLDKRGVPPLPPPPKPSARALLLDRVLDGLPLRDAVREVSALDGYARNEVYKASLEVADLIEEEE